MNRFAIALTAAAVMTAGVLPAAAEVLTRNVPAELFLPSRDATPGMMVKITVGEVVERAAGEVLPQSDIDRLGLDANDPVRVTRFETNDSQIDYTPGPA